MSVHKAISEHVGKQNKIITRFAALDQQREYYIEQALDLCRRGLPFSADKINEVTAEINELSKQGIIPARKYVTAEMIEEYASKTN
ncbi:MULTISPECIES: YpbS family protein [Bacillaceae]|uniref:YpbS family protein n=1 Tax=Bacillaceae TaxID=186817 RepID=UPI000BA64FC0|nr:MULTISPECIES: YpbS family protein [Bacillaceae]MCM3705080.1 YpbS family protein [Cytobacillus firmus]PAE26424.1 hypothetical protein CHI10_02665 [Bacillus sp. 7894-2]URM31317.1 YpbS family protein [Cytobacillus firmus]